MHKTRRRFVIASVAAFGTLSIGACVPHVTKDLFSDQTYYVKIETFAITSDRSKLVAIGRTRHYVFEIPLNFADLLESPIRQYLTAQFGTFTVDDGVVSGEFTLLLKKDVPEEIRRRATEMGFVRSGQLTKLDEKVSGQVFDARSEDVAAHAQRFTEPYIVRVRQRLSAGQKAARLPLTPLTLAADGGLLIGQIPLIILMAPFFAFSGPLPAFR